MILGKIVQNINIMPFHDHFPHGSDLGVPFPEFVSPSETAPTSLEIADFAVEALKFTRHYRSQPHEQTAAKGTLTGVLSALYKEGEDDVSYPSEYSHPLGGITNPLDDIDHDQGDDNGVGEFFSETYVQGWDDDDAGSDHDGDIEGEELIYPGGFLHIEVGIAKVVGNMTASRDFSVDLPLTQDQQRALQAVCDGRRDAISLLNHQWLRPRITDYGVNRMGDGDEDAAIPVHELTPLQLLDVELDIAGDVQSSVDHAADLDPDVLDEIGRSYDHSLEGPVSGETLARLTNVLRRLNLLATGQ